VAAPSSLIRDVGKALAAAERLESSGLRLNVVRSGSKYVVYIATADLLELAEWVGEIRRAVALYLADKAKNGTPMQREIAEKILKRNPLFQPMLFCSLKPASLAQSAAWNRRFREPLEADVFGWRLWTETRTEAAGADIESNASRLAGV
jgi:hypothetical protein